MQGMEQNWIGDGDSNYTVSMPRQTLYVQPNGMLIALMEMEGHYF